VRRASWATALVGLVLPLLALTFGGCSSNKVSLAASWPRASTEATVPAPVGAFTFPLTGLPIPPASSYPTAAACVKVFDSGAAAAFQGIGDADVIYETADSSKGTQLACIFQSRMSGRIGPLSGAGMPDLWLLPQYHAALFSTGATGTLSASFKRAGLYDLSDGSGAAGLAYVDVSRPASQTGTYLRADRAQAELQKLSSSIASESARLHFSESVETTGSKTKSVTVPFSASDIVEWSYDARTKSYTRTRDSVPQRDLRSGQRVTADNVVVMWAVYQEFDEDTAGSGGFDVTLGGSGEVTVLREGERYDGKWRADGQSPPTFTDDQGGTIRLAPGRTWIEVIPLSANIILR